MADINDPKFQSHMAWFIAKKGCAESRVVCAAIRKEGRMILGARHWDVPMHVTIGPDEKEQEFWSRADSGFIDQFGNYLTREEAFVIAERQGQIRHTLGNEHSKKLYSEHLY